MLIRDPNQELLTTGFLANLIPKTIVRVLVRVAVGKEAYLHITKE